MGISLAPILLIASIIPLALIAATVWLWVRVVRGFTSANRDSAVCGACGAGVRGITSFTCPECGADLREVGIVTPKAHGRVSLPVFVIGWTLLPLLPTLILLGLALAIGPQFRSTSVSVNLSKANNAFDFQADFEINGSMQGMSSTNSSTRVSGQFVSNARFQIGTTQPPRLISLTADINTLSHHASLTWRPDDGYFETQGPAGKSTLEPPLNPDDIEQLMTPADAASSELEFAQAPGIANGLNALADARPTIEITGFSAVGSSTSQTAMPRPWYVALLFAAILALYIAGILAYRRLRARADRPADATPDSPPV
ncbi:MAG: hypothetical protein AAF078_03775 [Planctomycetota bacterium]